MTQEETEIPGPIVSEFQKTLRSRVYSYLKENNLHPQGKFRDLVALLLIPLIIKIISPIVIVSCLYSFGFSKSLDILVILGYLGLSILFVWIGFNIMHSACHGTLFPSAIWNKIFAHALHLLGGSIFFWRIQHNDEHHIAPNAFGYDHDHDIPFLRVHYSQKYKWYYQYQHIYATLLYCMEYINWIFIADIRKYFVHLFTDSKKKMRWHEHIIFWIAKFCHVYFLIYLPYYYFGNIAILGYFIFAITTGLIISFVFQLAHLVEHTKIYGEGEQLPKNRLLRQFNTTANFAIKSNLCNWLLGGLNFQIEHHAFPELNHWHYAKIQPVVEQTCNEFKIPYYFNKTMLGALKSHFGFLKQMGQKPETKAF